MPYASKAQQRFFYAAASRGDIPEATVKEWSDATKKQPGGFKALPQRVGDDAKPKEACLLAHLIQPGLLDQLVIQSKSAAVMLPSLIKFSLQQMLGQLGPTAMKPPQPKPITLGGNTPALNPIGLMGGISAIPGKITGNAAFSGPKIKPM